jgi:small Trp-rich protein
MYFLGLGLLLLALKYFQISTVAQWSWWVVLAPFGLAILWWAWADSSGLTKRRVMERENQKKLDRIEKQKAELGIKPRKR